MKRWKKNEETWKKKSISLSGRLKRENREEAISKEAMTESFSELVIDKILQPLKAQ